MNHRIDAESTETGDRTKRPRRVFVTGATGFVGKHLVQHLLSSGTEVVVACRSKADLSAMPQPVSVVDYDLESTTGVDPSRLKGIDCIVHLAARVHVMRRSPDDFERFQSLNVRASELLARSAAAAGVRRFVFLSSVKANGERTTGTPFRPDDQPHPEDHYGTSKFEAESRLFGLAKETGLEVAVIRPPLVYGPGVGANFRRLLRLVHLAVPLPLASIRNQRSLVSVWNLVRYIELAAAHPDAAGGTWLVSDGEDISTPQLFRLIASAMKRPSRLLPFPVGLLRVAGRLTGKYAEVARLVDSLQVDVSRTREVLGWKPAVSVKEGMQRTVDWYLEATRAR